MIEIEVVYASVERQVLRACVVQEGTSVRAALMASGIADAFPELDLATCPVGIFGKVVADPERQVVQAADRLEIYRPLLADPKEIRRLRAAKAAQARQSEQ
ncbi:RnfH family protein [Pseudomonas thivervalensis]|uniref:RnfH family protein n=1 Tax=Pseudomonas thivervalensis TaxID=86265 RepID=UPI00069D71CA|nr:RnfH family protein [Pseudomonas thivervalensis]OAB52917.1 RnfH family protein [Pseudomonas thivervalensis]SDG15136.1 hypothetical protein SAMN04490204_3211 [Pseudomonas thivervalensis]